MLTEEMQLASGDPTALLNAMDLLLGEHGNIKTPKDVDAIISLMKDTERLLNRCIFLHILGATLEHAPGNTVGLDTVHRFVKDGGCSILNKWLLEAKEVSNFPLILEILELLDAMPVTVEALKQGNMGKLVKQLTKSEEKEVKRIATTLLNKWMLLVKGKPKKNKKQQQEKTNDDSSTPGSSPAAKRSRENSLENKTKQPPEKKPKSLAEAKNSVTSVAKPAAKTKIIPALPKPIVMESSGFMNALIQQSVPKIKKKKKVAPPPSPKDKAAYSGPLEEILQNQSQTHGDEKEKTEKEKGDKVEEKGTEQEEERNSNDAPKSQEPSSTESTSAEELALLSEKTNASLGPATDAANEIPATADSSEKSKDKVEAMESDKAVVEVKAETPKKKKNKRNIRWAEDDKLTQYHYYEPNEEEQVVQHVVNFHDAQHQEAMRERQRVEQAKRLSEDKMTEQQTWFRPKPFAFNEQVVRGENSQEKVKQRERESKILPDLFFSKSSLPISPREPDPEANTGPTQQPLVIPHDEKGTVYPPSKSAANVAVQPQRVENQNQAASLPPALAALLANASKGQGNQTNSSGAANNSALSNVDVQDLLKKLMGTSQNPDDAAALEESAKRLENELSLGNSRFPSPLMGQHLRVPGRMPGDQGSRPMPPEQLRQGVPDFRGRGILGNPGNLPEHMRFPGPMRGGPMRGRFMPPGGPRLRPPMPGQRMPGMGRGGMMNRFQLPDVNQNSEHDGGIGPRGRGMRLRGRPPMCRHFMSPRGCLRNNACPFIHPGVNAPPL